MKQVNFLPWRQQQQRVEIRRWLVCVIVITTLSVMMLLLWAIYQRTLVHTLQRDVSQAENTHHQLVKTYQHKKLQKAQKVFQQQQYQKQQKSLARKQRFIDLITMVPAAIWLTEMHDTTEFTVKGMAYDTHAVTLFIEQLKGMPNIERIEVSQFVYQAAVQSWQFSLTVLWQLSG